MPDKIVIDEDHGGYYRLWWWLAEDGDVGGMIGECQPTDKDEDAEADIAYTVASKSAGVERDEQGFLWAFRADAIKAASMVNKAVREVRKNKKIKWVTCARCEGIGVLRVGVV